MHFRSGIGRIEESFAETVRRTRSRESFIEQNGPVRNGIIELPPGRMPMLGPLIRMPSTHRCDPLSFRHIAPANGERFLNFSNRCRVFEYRVVARPIRET